MKMRFMLVSLPLVLASALASAQTSGPCTYGSDPIWYTCATPSNSGVGGETPSSRIDNRFYAGVVWEFDGRPGYMPDFLLGFRSLRVKSSNNADGGDFNLRIRYKADQFSLGSARLSYVAGKRDFLGNVGLGYSFASNGVFATAAVQTGFVRAGLDYTFNTARITPYFELNSASTPKHQKPKVTAGGLSCDPGYSLISAIAGSPEDLPNSVSDADMLVDGRTCASSTTWGGGGGPT